MFYCLKEIQTVCRFHHESLRTTAFPLQRCDNAPMADKRGSQIADYPTATSLCTLDPDLHPRAAVPVNLFSTPPYTGPPAQHSWVAFPSHKLSDACLVSSSCKVCGTTRAGITFSLAAPGSAHRQPTHGLLRKRVGGLQQRRGAVACKCGSGLGECSSGEELREGKRGVKCTI